MHIRKTITASRAARIGTVLVMAAGIVVFTATPSFAVTLVLSQSAGPAAGTNKITISGASFAAGAAVEFQTANPCSTNWANTGVGVVAATVATFTAPATSLTVTVPTLTATSWNVCAYTGATTAATQTAITASTPYVASAALTSLGIAPTGGPRAGGTVLTATDNATAFGVGTTVEFTSTACPATYTATSTTVLSVTPATFTPGVSVLSVTAPAGLTLPGYYVCAYTGNTAASSALITGTSTAAYAITPLTLSQARGPAAGTNTITATDANVTFTGSTVVEFQTALCSTNYTAPSSGFIAGTVASFVANTLTITVPVLPAGPYYVCAYNGILSSTPLLSGTTTAAYTTAAATTMSVTPNTARTNIVVLDAGTAFGAGTTVEFNSAACPATYPTPSGTGVVAGTVATFTPGATSLTVTPPAGMTAGSYYVCAYTGSAGSSALVSKTAAADYTAYGVLTLSSNNGPSGVANSITATTSSGIFLTGTVVIVKPIAAACPATYSLSGSAVAAQSVRVLLPTKLAFTVPTSVVSGSPGPSYNICAYTGTSGSLISETVLPYVVAAQATITGVSPAGGPAQGGTVITVTGTNLGTVVSATVGGVALTINPASIGVSSFTATTPAHAAGGPFTIAVVTLSGPASKVGAFTYSNGIVVAPNKASNSGSVDIDVQGIGFGAMTFPMSDGSTPNDDSGHVYLVRGRYDPTSLVAVGSYKANDALLECTDVLVISDTELVCTLALAGNGVRPAWRSAVAVTDVTVAKGSSTLVSASSASFTSRDIGLTVGAVGIPDGTTIVSVLSATEVVLSAKSTAAIATSASVSLSPPHPVTLSLTTTASTTLTTAGTFSAFDVGSTITGAGIPAGTTITGIAGNSLSVTLSAQASVTASEVVTIGNPAVADGSYTVTVVSSGLVDAGGANYSQSIISSGSTFTVADY